MPVQYFQRQTNWLTLIFSVISLLISIIIILGIKFDPELLQNLSYYFHFSNTEMYLYPILTLLGVFIITALFSSMVITLNKRTLKWYFGPGIWRKKISLADIERYDKVRNKWWNGWGTRRFKQGWLYNVSGLDAIEITLNSSKKIRLGTNDPAKLCKAISKGIEKLNRLKSNKIG